MGGLCEALEEFAVSKPLILILEDLHWADGATLNLISALARRRGSAKLLVVATLRPANAATEHPLRALKQDLLMRRLCAEIALKPLGKTAVGGLLRKELQQEGLPEGLGGFVHQRSEGNPLFAIAIVEHLIEKRVLVRHGADSAAQWELDKPLKEIEAGVPAELAQMVELEIEQVSAEEQLVLEAGSLMNTAFPAWAVAAALGMDCNATEEICDALARRVHFLKCGGEDQLPDGSCSGFYVFSHEIYREVLYQRQSPRRRARGHIRIAERLSEIFKGREADVAREMAVHFEAAGSWQRAADALHSAARHAQVRQAHVQAAELMEHARRLELNVSGVNAARGAARSEMQS
jgi:predicted ATPase